MLIDFKNSLNTEQYEVVTGADGPCLVLAGAGSGKTRTLVYRVAYLLEQGIYPDHILLVTFTNKAAHEMMSRVESLIGRKPVGLWGGTFHHIGNIVLRENAKVLGYKSNFNILDSEDSDSFLNKVLVDLNLNNKTQNFPKASVVRSIISFARNKNEPVREAVINYYGYTEFIADKIAEVSDLYQVRKVNANVMDFDDLLINWLRLLQDFPEIREKYAKQFQYILVDEYQDTNFVQAEIINELARVHQNVLVVGDDSQSIYSFRAADVNNILNFPKIFANSKIYKIEINYRSTPQILDLANNIIKHNVFQFEKNLLANKSSGDLPLLVPVRDVYQQASTIVHKIRDIYSNGRNFSEIAVLYRSNYQSAELQLEFSKQNIPYVVRGGMRYFEQAHIKDVIAYLKIVANWQDVIAWQRVLSIYDGMGPKAIANFGDQLQKITNKESLFIEFFKFSGKAVNSWERVKGLLQKLFELNYSEKGSMATAVEYVLASIYESYLKSTYDNYRERLEDLEQLMNFLALYTDLEKLLADVMLSENFSTGDKEKKESVVLSTIHQAKGLEWSFVFIVGLTDGHFPNQRYLENETQLEEERRLFYVATTRAKEKLFLFYPMRAVNFNYGEQMAKPSMFVRELDKKLYTVEQKLGFWSANEKEDDSEETIYYD